MPLRLNEHTAAQRAHSAHFTARNWGFSGQTAIFLPIQTILHPHDLGQWDESGGGGLQLVLMRHPPPPASCKKLAGGGSAGGWGGGLAAWPGGGGGAARNPLLSHAYLKGVAGGMGV